MGKRIATEEKQTELIQEIHNLNQEILSVSEYKNAAQAAATTATTKASEASTSAAAAAASASDADTAATALTTWLADKEELTAPAVDPTLTISGAAADSKVTGDIRTRLDNIETVDGRFLVPLTFLPTNGFYDYAGTFVPYSDVYEATVDVVEGEVYLLTSRNYYSIPRAIFWDENDGFVSFVHTGSDTQMQIDTRVVIPATATKMMLQSYETSSPVELNKLDLAKKLNDVYKDVSAIASVTTQPQTEDVALTFNSVTGYYQNNKAYNPYSGVTAAKVTVNEGETYYLTSRNFYNAALACMLDSSDNVIDVVYISNDVTPQKNLEIKINKYVSSLLIQRFYNYEPTKLTKKIGIEIKSVNSILSGKKISVIGDSITEYNFRAKTNWALYLNDWCNVTVQNLGASGTGFRAGYAQNKNYYPRIASIANDTDVIGVALSFNDIANVSVVIGTINDTTADDTVAGYANDFFDALITAYPTTPIICYCQGPWYAMRYGSTRSDQWVNLLSEICMTRGIPFYDGLYKGTVLKPWILANRSVYYVSDNDDLGNTGVVDDTHPNSEGHKVIARYLYPKFAQNLVAVGLDYLM